MIAAAARAAGLTDPNVVKEFEVEMTVAAKIWAYDAKEARRLSLSTSNWHDWEIYDPRDELVTGRV